MFNKKKSTDKRFYKLAQQKDMAFFHRTDTFSIILEC